MQGRGRGLTSDHSPVIQMYSQGGSAQLCTSGGRSLGSQRPLLCGCSSSSTHNTSRNRDASPHVFVHCVRQTAAQATSGTPGDGPTPQQPL